MGPIKQKKGKIFKFFSISTYYEKNKCVYDRSPITTYGTWARGSDSRVGPIWAHSKNELNL